ncbi:MAG: hypothetical protein ACE5GC_01650 [Acidimicrobiia bacterium]
MDRTHLDRPEQPDHRRTWRVVVPVLGVVVAAAFILLTGQDEPVEERVSRTIAEAGLPEVEFAIIGASRVVEVEGGHFKASLLTVQGGELRGTGTLTRVADQVRGRPVECLGDVYDDPQLWTSTTSGTGDIDFHDAGSITLSVTITSVDLRPLAEDPVCIEIAGTYAGAGGTLSDVAGTVAAGIGRGRPQFWTFDP